jgi:hypothetical protein
MQSVRSCAAHAEVDIVGDDVTRSLGTRRSATIQRLQILSRARRYGELRDELARAEIAEEIPEFYALSFQAILAMSEGSELAGEYLEMAEAVAGSPYEAAIVAEHRAAHDLLQGNPFAAAERCLANLDYVCQTEELWNKLLIALHRLGEVETIDATLRSFARLSDECTARLVPMLLSEPELREVRTRPAFRELLQGRSAG